MDYLTKKRLKRLLGSFNEDLCKKYEEEIGNINKKAKKIQRLAEQGSRAELRAVRLEVENLRRNVVAGQEGEARMRAEILASANRMEAEQREAMKRREVPMQRQLMDQLAGTLNQLLSDEALQAMVNIRATTQAAHQGSVLPIEYAAGLVTLPQSATAIPRKSTTTADEVLLSSKHLEDFFDRNRVRLPGLHMRPVTQTEEVIRRLSLWIKEEPGILWLEGPETPLRDEYNPLTTIAARVVDLADKGNVPVIS
ncbi:hypothetical protein PG996_006102 [Apiospora saccharicola]|uniref:Uncharacterized protein n=1 Tax=Apiospora saccharicola TaxID=335842 RepID=A0ABR1VS70_9PEZI